MAKSKNKKPIIKENVNNKKEAKIKENPDSFYDDNPKWQFSKRDKTHKKWKVCDISFDESLLNKLESLEKMKWREILTDTSGRSSNTKSHRMEIDKIDKDAQKQLKQMKLYDYAADTLHSLSLEGKYRLWGFLKGGVFEILWCDKEHEIYKVNKKHT